MFFNSMFNNDISKWDVSNVINMCKMFMFAPFKINVSNWNVSNVKYHDKAFDNCFVEDEMQPKFVV